MKTGDMYDGMRGECETESRSAIKEQEETDFNF